MTQQNKDVSKTFYHITKNRVPYLEKKWKRQKNLQFHRLVVEVLEVVVVVVAKEKKEEKDTQKNTEEKETEDENWQKNADYWPFLALFQGKELFFVLCGKKFLIRPLPFGLNSCMTQKTKGVSKTFYHIRKNRVPYLEIKWKRQKNLQFDRLVVVVVVVVAKEKKEEKDTQNTQKKKKQRMKTDKKYADYWPFLALFQGKEL